MKSRQSLKQSTSPRLKQKLKLRHYIAAGVALAIIVGVGIFIYLNLGTSPDLRANKNNQGYYSKGTSKWSDVSSWTKSQSWMNSSPGNNVNTDFIDIYGKITSDNDLTIGGNTILTVYDTLWISGKLTFTGSGSLDVKPGGVLIVEKDYITAGGSALYNSGKIVVMNDLTASGGANVENDLFFYIVGQATASGGTTFNGEKNNTANADFGDKDQLMVNDPLLFNFIYPGEAGALPVSLLYYKINLKDKQVIAEWATAAEKNNDYFTVERSADGKKFYEVGSIVGAGDSNNRQAYKFFDPSPLSGKSYYRLKQTDYDGKFEYIGLELVSNQAHKAGISEIEILAVGPNPFQQAFFVEFELTMDNLVELRLMNMQGNLVLTETINGYAGSNRFNFTDNQGLATGTYLLTLRQNNINSKAIRLIKQ